MWTSGLSSVCVVPPPAACRIGWPCLPFASAPGQGTSGRAPDVALLPARRLLLPAACGCCSLLLLLPLLLLLLLLELLLLPPHASRRWLIWRRKLPAAAPLRTN